MVESSEVKRGTAKVLSGDAPQSNGLVTRRDVSLWYSAVRSSRVQSCQGTVISGFAKLCFGKAR